MTDQLDEFRAAYEADDNHWWRTESGLHQVVFDEACDRLDAAEAEVRALRDVVDAVRQWGPHTPRRVTRALQALAATDRPPTWRAGHGPEPPTGTCICPRFKDTGGFRIADLACPVHGVDGTDPGDGYWADVTGDGMMQSVWPKKAGVDTVDLADSDDGTPDTQQREEDT